MAALVCLLAATFTQVALVKPITSRPASSERYLVCVDRRSSLAGGTAPGGDGIDTAVARLWEWHRVASCDDGSAFLVDDILSASDRRRVSAYLAAANKRFAFAQAAACEDIIKWATAEGTDDDDIGSACAVDAPPSAMGWHYLDPSGARHGPFRSDHMAAWEAEGHFDDSTVMCFSQGCAIEGGCQCGHCSDFSTLDEWRARSPRGAVFDKVPSSGSVASGTHAKNRRLRGTKRHRGNPGYADSSSSKTHALLQLWGLEK